MFVSFYFLAYCIQAPGINWTTVIENLDHEGFFVPNEEAFSFLMSVFKHACKVYRQNVDICFQFNFSPSSQCLTPKTFIEIFDFLNVSPCRSHFLSMLSVDLSGRMLRASYLSLNMLYQHLRKYLPLSTLSGSWYDALST